MAALSEDVADSTTRFYYYIAKY